MKRFSNEEGCEKGEGLFDKNDIWNKLQSVLLVSRDKVILCLGLGIVTFVWSFLSRDLN